jgi:myo-inositol-1-phosphate synthase
MTYRQGNESLSKMRISVQNEHVVETESEILAKYEYKTTRVMFDETENAIKLQPIAQNVTFKTIKTLPKLGLMMVGWGGNNGNLPYTTVIHQHIH